MKNTYTKISLALTAALACAGMISASAQTAQAEIVLTSASPVATHGSVAGTYDFTYYLTFGAAGTTLLGAESTNQAFISLELNGPGSSLVSTPSLTITNTGILGSFGSAGDTSANGGTYKWVYTGTTYTSAAGSEALGYITVVSTTSNEVVGPGLNYTTQAATNVTSSSPNGQTDLTQKQVDVPGLGVVPTGAVPLPAAFWPTLLTLTGMAVVGGLKFRHKAL
ncbi:MAG: hypothetical protein ACP5QA_13135 [Phycisphaerae bacterium]